MVPWYECKIDDNNVLLELSNQIVHWCRSKIRARIQFHNLKLTSFLCLKSFKGYDFAL